MRIDLARHRAARHKAHAPIRARAAAAAGTLRDGQFDRGTLAVLVEMRGELAGVHWTHRDVSRAWSPEDGWKDLPDGVSVISCVKGATAPLGRYAHWVISLLSPPEGSLGSSIRDLENLAYEGREKLSGRPCHRIRGELLGQFEDAHIEYQPGLDPNLDFERVLEEFRVRAASK